MNLLALDTRSPSSINSAAVHSISCWQADMVTIRPSLHVQAKEEVDRLQQLTMDRSNLAFGSALVQTDHSHPKSAPAPTPHA